MRLKLRLRCWPAIAVVGASIFAMGRGVSAQVSPEASSDKLQQELLRRPLYLRGAWMEKSPGRSLEFDAAGKPIGAAQPGPLTLSGIDVTGIVVKGSRLTIHGDRVALVADANGRLQRLGIFSTTVIDMSLRRGDGKNCKAKDGMKIVVRADQSGSFEPALHAIFADGLADLAPSVPRFWSCYAAGYFARDLPNDEAERTVAQCVRAQGVTPEILPASEQQALHEPARMVSSVNPQPTVEAAELGVGGMSRVHLVLGPHGLPVRFQIVRAVGAGLDEATLQAVAQSRFEPATRNGQPVASDFDFTMTYQTRQ